MSHTCFEQVDTQLKEHNARLDLHLQMNFKTGVGTSVLCMPLVKINTKIRRPLPLLVCTYCPVCGKKLGDE